MNPKLIIGACLGECVHVAGIVNFLGIAGRLGFETRFLGPAVPVDRVIEACQKFKPYMVALSYRLTPTSASLLFEELSKKTKGLKEIKFVFGGTLPVAEIARKTGIFDAIFSENNTQQDVVNYLENKKTSSKTRSFAQTLVERIEQQRPFPLLRHHLGLETVEKTVENARVVAESEQLDVLSLAPDQNAQQYFFRPHLMPNHGHGAGGVPVRKQEDLRSIYEATRCGNYPLVRCYAGTYDLLKWAKLTVETLNNAWAAIPIFWYSKLDGRSERGLADAIKENQQTIKWYAQHNIPVEVNDSHQWSLRDASDAVAVATAFLGAYNAKALGVRHYVAQYMLNTPPQISPSMDLAKMLAKIELIESLHDEDFTSFRQIRTGLRSMVSDLDMAKGNLSATIFYGMLLQPHIVHVVGYCEARYAATSKEIIESCKIARGAILASMEGFCKVLTEPSIQKRKEELIKEAKVILSAIRNLGKGLQDPLVSPEVLEKAVRMGILDAPHLAASGIAPGKIVTILHNGCCITVDPSTGRPLSEEERLKSYLN